MSSYLDYLMKDVVEAAENLHKSGDFEAARGTIEKIKENARLEDEDIKSKIQDAEEKLIELRLLQKELNHIEETQISRFEECIDAGPIEGADDLDSLLYRINGTKTKLVKKGYSLLQNALRKR